MTRTKAKATKRVNKALTIPRHFGTITLVSWTPPAKEIPLKQWQAAGRELGRAGSAVRWWLADWWAFGEHAYGERTAALAESCIDMKVQTLMNYARVARAVETYRRREVLSFSHHAEVTQPSIQSFIAPRSSGWMTRLAISVSAIATRGLVKSANSQNYLAPSALKLLGDLRA
jgi:hypothetical protein